MKKICLWSHGWWKGELQFDPRKKKERWTEQISRLDSFLGKNNVSESYITTVANSSSCSCNPQGYLCKQWAREQCSPCSLHTSLYPARICHCLPFKSITHNGTAESQHMTPYSPQHTRMHTFSVFGVTLSSLNLQVWWSGGNGNNRLLIKYTVCM